MRRQVWFSGYFLGFCHQNTRLRHIIKTHYYSKYMEQTIHLIDCCTLYFVTEEQKIHPVVTVSMLKNDILVLWGLVKGPLPYWSYVAHTMNWGFCWFFSKTEFSWEDNQYTFKYSSYFSKKWQQQSLSEWYSMSRFVKNNWLTISSRNTWQLDVM